MTDDQLKDVMTDGQNSQSFLDNQAYRKAKLIVRAELVRQFEKTKTNQSHIRDEIWRKLQALEYIERALNMAAQKGRIAEKTLLERIKNNFKLVR